MNLDKTFCASDCLNLKCDRMIRMAVLKAAIKTGRPANTISMTDFSATCDDYIKPEEK